MEEFAALIDALVYTRSRNEKLRLIAEYLRATPDPDRGWALAALADGLDFPAVKSSTIRNLLKDRIDPVLRALFRAGGAELAGARTPPKVVITEYVRIAEAFFPDGREPKFVNGVLDHMARDLRPDAFDG